MLTSLLRPVPLSISISRFCTKFKSPFLCTCVFNYFPSSCIRWISIALRYQHQLLLPFLFANVEIVNNRHHGLQERTRHTFLHHPNFRGNSMAGYDSDHVAVVDSGEAL